MNPTPIRRVGLSLRENDPRALTPLGRQISALESALHRLERRLNVLERVVVRNPI